MTEYFAYDVRGIKNFIFESNEFRCIHGASRLLDDFDQSVQEILKELGLTCIFAGGGTGLFRLPENADIKKDKIEEQIENIRAKYLMDHHVEYVFVDPDTVQTSLYPDAHLDSLDSFDENNYSKFFARIALKLNKEKNRFKPQGEIRVKKLCRLCGCREASETIIVADEEGYQEKQVCKMCYKKFNRAKQEKGQFFSLNDISECSTRSSSDQESEKAGYIAVIYGDGNSFGNIYKKFTVNNDFKEYKGFSKDLKQFTDDCRALLTRTAKRYVAPLLGGDDILVFLSPSQMFDTLNALVKEISNRRFGGHKLTFSFGVAVVPSTLPLKFIFNTAQTLLKAAKKRRYEIKEGFAISFRYLKSFDLNPCKEVENISFGDGFTKEEFDRILEIHSSFHEMLQNRSTINKIYQIVSQQGENRAAIKITLEYFLFRAAPKDTDVSELVRFLLHLRKGKYVHLGTFLDICDFMMDFSNNNGKGG